MKIFFSILMGILLGGVSVYWFMAASNVNLASHADDKSDEPLYWVAPMDPNYRRDKPGKSPMGMDLIPVYDEGDQGASSDVVINPTLENNLGVKTAKVTRRDIQKAIEGVGYVRYDESKLVHIHPRANGWIEKLFVTAKGDRVKKGQPLYQIYSPDFLLAQEEFLLALKQNNPYTVNGAKARLRTLKIPESVIAELEKTRQVQTYVTFFAPQDGVINQLNIREGFYVEPRTTMMSIGDLSEVWVDVEIFKSDLDKVQVGQIAKLEWFDDRTSLTSKVDFVYPEVDMITRTGKARLVISNPDRHFQPNDFAKVKILQDSPDLINQLSLPRESVIYVNGETRVVVANGNGKFDVRTVSVGPSDDSFVSVLNGLAEGERVVISAQFLLDSEASKSGELSRLQHEHMDHSEMDHSEMNHSEMNHSEMDHSEMDHSEMNHSEMNHSEMNHSEMNHSEMDHSQTKSKFPSATVDGVINSISLDSRMANISRGPIEKWGREATTMDFVIDSSIKIESLELNSSIQFTFEIRSGDFVVTEVSDSTSQ